MEFEIVFSKNNYKTSLEIPLFKEVFSQTGEVKIKIKDDLEETFLHILNNTLPEFKDDIKLKSEVKEFREKIAYFQLDWDEKIKKQLMKLISKRVEKLFTEPLERKHPSCPNIKAKIPLEILDKEYVSLEFIEECLEKNIVEIKKDFWDPISMNPSITPEFAEKHIEFISPYVSANPSFSEDFFIKHPEKYIVTFGSANPSLSAQFIEKKLLSEGKITSEGKYSISRHTNISEEFLENHRNDLSWNNISMNSKFSRKFFEKHVDRLNLYYLIQNDTIGEEFLEKYFKNHPKFSEYLSATRNPWISPKFIEKYGKLSLVHPKMPLDRMEQELASPNRSPVIYENTGIPLDLLVRYLPENREEWEALSSNSSLEPDFIRIYDRQLDWKLLKYNNFYTYISNEINSLLN